MASIDKAETVLLELFEHQILIKSLPMYLRIHIEEDPFIATLPIGRPNISLQRPYPLLILLITVISPIRTQLKKC